MKINEIIKEKRSEQGLTQEQIAELLGVSTPAVNKWERGVSYPDITLLPPLARLLKVDLNTLLSFNEDLTDQEIGSFINDISILINNKGFKVAYEKAMDKLQEYPSCDKLTLNIALVLQGALIMGNVEDREDYEEHIDKLFEKSFISDNEQIRNQVAPMIINKYIAKKEYNKAQEYIDKLPNITYDKKFLQAKLYKELQDINKAAEILEGKLLSSTNEIFTALFNIMEIALEEERNEDAEYYAKVLEKTADLYELWDYNAYAAYFQLYVKQKNADKCIEILKKMLLAIKSKWNIEETKLYKHMKKKDEEKLMYERFLKGFINSLEKSCDDELSFLKGNKEFINLLDQYK